MERHREAADEPEGSSTPGTPGGEGTGGTGARARRPVDKPPAPGPAVARRRRKPPVARVNASSGPGSDTASARRPTPPTSGATASAAGASTPPRSGTTAGPARRPTPPRKVRDREAQQAAELTARNRIRRRSRRMSTLARTLIALGAVALVVAVVLLVVEPAFDRRFRREAEANINQAVTRRMPGAVGVRSAIEGDHLAWSAVTSGEIERVRLKVDRMTYQGAQLRNINGQVDTVRIDPDEARSQRVKVLGTGPFRMGADIGEADVARIGGASGLRIYEGRADADGFAGQRAQITLLPGGVLVGTLLGREVARHQLPTARELGCNPTYRFVPGALRVQCTGTSVPATLLP